MIPTTAPCAIAFSLLSRMSGDPPARRCYRVQHTAPSFRHCTRLESRQVRAGWMGECCSHGLYLTRPLQLRARRSRRLTSSATRRRGISRERRAKRSLARLRKSASSGRSTWRPTFRTLGATTSRRSSRTAFTGQRTGPRWSRVLGHERRHRLRRRSCSRPRGTRRLDVRPCSAARLEALVTKGAR